METIKIKNALDLCIIDIEGTIGVPEEWQFENPQQRVATYERFREEVAHIKEVEAQRVVVNIRSTGGDVNDALLIYDALVSLEIPITTRCYGYVASAATVIAQAASQGERQISANALYLIHNSSCAAEGNAVELVARAELLRKTDEQLAALYARCAGREVEVFSELMARDGGKGEWLTSAETIELGLADSVVEVMVEETETEETEEALTETEETTETAETDGTEETAETPSGVTNLIKRIGERLGFLKQEATPKSELPTSRHNVLHEPIRAREEQVSRLALEEGQKCVSKTRVTPAEDVSLMDAIISPNAAAYSADARRFAKY